MQRVFWEMWKRLKFEDFFLRSQGSLLHPTQEDLTSRKKTC